MDSVVKEVQARTLGKEAQLVTDGDEKWEESRLLFADDTVLVADSKGKLERARLCGLSELRWLEMSIVLDGQVLEEVEP